jgi:hypothetical protein
MPLANDKLRVVLKLAWMFILILVLVLSGHVEHEFIYRAF